jgi:hypothetical protein
MNMKICNECGIEKSWDEFYKKTDPDPRVHGQPKSRCKECYKRVCKRTPEQNRAKHLRDNYKISPAEYEKLYLEQEGKCGICKKDFEQLHVDHCHDSQEIRGLLCKSCNTALGLFKDDVELMQNAISYLINHLVKV